MTATETKSDYTPSGLVYLAAVVVLVVLGNLVMVYSGNVAVGEGALTGPDSYMRLVRVTQLYESGDWFDHSIPRSNAPFGEILHWTRPADLLHLSGALLLEPFVGFERGLYLWGIVTGPLLHVAMVLVLMWATTPLLDHLGRFLLVLALLTEMAIWPHGVLGRTDHHMLIMLVFAASLGGAIRIMARPVPARTALLAGAAAGFGLWLSVEFLVGWAILFGALSICWIRRGGAQARRNLWHALGMAGVVMLALAVERLPSAWFAEEYDRISVVHLLVALLAAAFWAASDWLAASVPAAQAPRGRVAICAAGAFCAGAALLLVFPKFFGGPEVDYPPELKNIFLDRVSETRPLLPVNLHQTGWLLLYLGQAVVAVPYLLVRLWRRRDEETWYGWVLIALGLLLYLPLAVYMRRFGGLAALLLAVVVADCLGTLLAREPQEQEGPKRLLILGLAIPGVLFGGLAVGGILLKQVNALPAPENCPANPLVKELNRADGLGRTPHTVLALVNFGPQLMYQTRHSVVATPYPRNPRGQIDAVRIYAATDPAEAHRLVEARGIDVIATCTRRPTYWDMSEDPDSLDSRLRRGELPAWLTAVELDEETRGEIGLFRVVPHGGELN